MSEVLTREIFEQFSENAFRFTPRQREVVCHPIDAPFMNALLNLGKDVAKVYELWRECKRKWNVGGKRDIAKWKLGPLIEQYSIKLECLPSQRVEKVQ